MNDVSLELAQGRCLISQNTASTTETFLGLATKNKAFLENVRFGISANEFLAEKVLNNLVTLKFGGNV